MSDETTAALNKASESQTRQGRCRPGQNGGLAAIFGQWPGDETDEEIEAALAEMERCHCGGDAEIARLTRELEEARERERAVRDEATEYLAEIAETLADMHYGEECSFEGGDGCLACYAQDRIAEMQDALAARTTTTERER